MKRNFRIITLIALLLLTAVLAGSLAMMAASPARQQSITPSASSFDIRTDGSKETLAKRIALRQKLTPQQRARQAEAARGINEARAAFQRNGSGEVMLSALTGGPEIVSASPDGGNFLTVPSAQTREQIVRNFLAGNVALYGLTAEQTATLTASGDYLNPAGNLGWLTLDQKFNDIPVFAGQLRAGLTSDGQLVRTVSTMAAGIDETQLRTTPAITAAQAVAIAAAAIGVNLAPASLTQKSSSADGRKLVFARGPFDEDIKVEQVYFPLEVGLVDLGWSMVLWQDVPAYYTVVDAESGEVLFRKNITNEQTQAATYAVYNDDSPAPLSPSNATPGSGIQGAGISRSLQIVISELPAFDNLGWITDGGNTTTGNNADAGLDIDGSNGIDAGGRATGSPLRVFDFSYNPPPLGTDAPSLANYRMGVVTDLFFWSNRYHDQLYQYGFTEPAGNFQSNNFGRGGLGLDFVRAEAQDSGGTNNANFSTPPDGSLPRMQMYLFTAPNPDRDGSIDHDIVLHELTHGLSNRLHGNASGLNTTQSGGMGEGWSDYYARVLLSTADEDVNGVYAAGAYATLNLSGVGTNNYYYGIRRFPYAVKTNLGTNGRPHNPLTFADIDPTQINLTDGAFAAAFTGRAEEVHNIGEVWCMALLEVRARLITRLGFVAGNARALQIVTDGMKLDPVNPTLLDARNAIVLADRAGFGGADEADIWAGFAARGMGFSAKINGGVSVTEAFDLPNLSLGAVTFSDAGCNNNGAADPGETLTLTVPVSNLLNTNATGVTATVAGGGTGNYGAIPAGNTSTRTISYTVPAGSQCGTVLNVTVNINSSFGAVARTFPLLVGQLLTTFNENFDGVTAPGLPAGWTTSSTAGITSWTTSTTSPDTAPNAAFTPNGGSVGSSTLISPNIPISIAGARLTFRHSYDFEEGFDGGALEIKIGAGSFTDILTAGGAFLTTPYNEVLPPSVAECTHGLPRHNAWTGNSGGYVTTVVQLPAAAAGQTIQLRWIAGFDCNTAETGWRVDSINIGGNAACSATGCCPTISINQTSLPAGTVGTAYSQTLTATGGAGAITFSVIAGTLPNGLTLSGAGLLSGIPLQTASANVTIQATDTNGCFGTQVYTITIVAGAASGLQFYPLPRPVRLLDTRASQGNCDSVSAPIPAGTSLTTLARATCESITIPPTAQAITGNLTVINQSAQTGYLTIYPDGLAVPLAANMIYEPGQILSNNFTVGLSADGKFNVFGERTIDVIMDISGYYAPPGAGGLYYHPLSKPIRLLDSRAGSGNCDSVSSPIPAGTSLTTLARTTCESLTIPTAAQAIAGNATVINGSGQTGYLTIYPNGVSVPLAANMVYTPGQILSNAFTVSLNASGEFNIFGERQIDMVIDVAGYFSNEANDVNGPGLLFTPLVRPLRLLDTRAGQGNCDSAGTPISGGTSITTLARTTCESITIPATAQSIIGNVTVINQTGQAGYLTLYPTGVTQPLAANMVYFPGQLLSNAFVVGLNGTGQFNTFAERTLEAIIDVSGYFAP
ncbi:MAG: M36 family metallopeptidase [Acidobacteriota bacterium]